jgi:hypothetical protein
MSKNVTSRWEEMRTPETRMVERTLRSEFPGTDAYRYNSASIRIRVVDARFKGKSSEERDAMVEPLIEKLPRKTQADIMNLITLYPGEADDTTRAGMANMEFEDPSPSIL